MVTVRVSLGCVLCFGAPWAALLGFVATGLAAASDARFAVAVLLGIAIAVAVLIRALTIVVRVTDGEVLIRNLFVTRRLARRELADWVSVTVHPGGTPTSLCLGALLADGRVRTALATFRLSDRRLDLLHRRLRKTRWPMTVVDEGV